VREEQEQEST